MLPRRVLVLGVDTGLGRVLAPRLARHGDLDVLGADRPSGAPPTGVSFVPLTPSRPDDVRRLLLDFAPHTVVYLSRWHDASRCDAARSACNAALADTVAVLARACLGTGARLVVHSSDLVFDGTPGRVYAETDRPRPATAPGKHHLAAENAVRGAGLDRWAVVRTGPLVGTDDPADPLRRAAAGRATAFEHAHAALARPYTHVRDAALGFERLLRTGRGGVYHVAGHDLYTPATFADAVRHRLGLPPLLCPPPPASAATALLTLRAETEWGLRSSSAIE